LPWTSVANVSTGDVLAASTFNNQVIGNLTALRGDYATSRYTGGNLSLNSTSWASVGGPADLVLAASAGDLVECSISFSTNNDAVIVYYDVVTVVAATVTNSFATAGTLPTTSHEGIVGWTGQASVSTRHTGNFFYTLAAGDISSGTVTLRLRYRTNTASTKTMFASANFPQVFFARNHGPVEI
jgi:hypothetical protein